MMLLVMFFLVCGDKSEDTSLDIGVIVDFGESVDSGDSASEEGAAHPPA